MGKGKRRRVVLDVRWTPEARRIIKAIERATATLKALGKKGLPVMVTMGKGRRRRAVKLGKDA